MYVQEKKKRTKSLRGYFSGKMFVSKNKFVRTTMRLFNAIFFSIFFSFYGCYLFQLSCTIEYPLISLDFVIDFAIFTMWLQMCGWTDRQTDEQNNRQTDIMMGGQTNKWMDMQHTIPNNKKDALL